MNYYDTWLSAFHQSARAWTFQEVEDYIRSSFITSTPPKTLAYEFLLQAIKSRAARVSGAGVNTQYFPMTRRGAKPQKHRTPQQTDLESLAPPTPAQEAHP